MESVAISAAQINWNGGQRITLTAGDTATCTALSPGQLYGSLSTTLLKMTTIQLSP
ncbi:hypothetical protein [Pseudomonas sp. S2_A02]